MVEAAVLEQWRVGWLPIKVICPVPQQRLGLAEELAGREVPDLEPLKESFEQIQRENTAYAQKTGALRQKLENRLRSWRSGINRQRRAPRLNSVKGGHRGCPSCLR